MLRVNLLPALQDNYIYVLRDELSGKVGVIDPGVAEPVLSYIRGEGMSIDYILNTHHHWDHTGGNLEIKSATGCCVVGFSGDSERIAGIDIEVSGGEQFALGDSVADIIEIFGHTIGHIAYSFAGSGVVFSGDTLFSMGCGRLFEGSASEMWLSLLKLRSLPDETLVYCGHEYTLANGIFCERFVGVSDASDSALSERMVEVRNLRERGLPTVPVAMGVERLTNIFLRCDEEGMGEHLGMAGADGAEVFAYLRGEKDNS